MKSSIQTEPTGISHVGTKYWKNAKGQFHRLDGPALVYNDGDLYWYINGKQHRDDGPAVIRKNGSMGWYLKNRPYTLDEYIKKKFKSDAPAKTAFLLRWAK